MAKSPSRKPRTKRPTQSLPESDPTDKPFTPFLQADLDRTVVALPLLERIGDKPDSIHNVIIEVNLNHPGGRGVARDLLWNLVDKLTGRKTKGARLPPDKANPTGTDEGINRSKSEYSQQYLFARLSGHNIRKLVRRDEAASREAAKEEFERRVVKAETRGPEGFASERKIRPQPALYRIWLDHEVKPFITKSISTVKADAARNAFAASGTDIVWAVVDTGVDQTHPQFQKHMNLDLQAPLLHRDFTTDDDLNDQELSQRAVIDHSGHGTHVAGIIAGEIAAEDGYNILAEIRQRDEAGEVEKSILTFPFISGMAPRCKLLSLKVLNDKGDGLTSNLIAALEYIQELNGNGRRLRVHGVNMSVGYDFEPKWFACGQSPLCVEVNRLVQSGVVVVVAAGNTGYGIHNTASRGPVSAGLDLTINDPGNAEFAITVGSTHREMPHIYGVSYFSSKGPTGDGRLKPDIVAPGEKIISCASSQSAPIKTDSPSIEVSNRKALYREDSGTSMAAPHVSGAIAAFLSARREFIGSPGRVKEIFLSTATDLKRAVYFQGKGLVDLMRAIQSV